MIQQNGRYEKIISTIALLFSVIGIGIAVRSCQISESTYELAKEEFAGKILVVLNASFDPNKDEMKISSVGETFIIQHANIYFPQQLTNEIYKVRQPTFTIQLTKIKDEIKKTMVTKLPKQNLFARDRVVPIIIETNYVSQGQNLTDFSLYQIYYEGHISEDESSTPTVVFNGLVFIRRLNSDEIERKESYLMNRWEDVKDIQFNINQ